MCEVYLYFGDNAPVRVWVPSFFKAALAAAGLPAIFFSKLFSATRVDWSVGACFAFMKVGIPIFSKIYAKMREWQ
jgi:hypothetical protein